MSLSRRAKRGISAFSKIQWSGKRALYHLSQKNMISFGPMENPFVKAATEAMEILIKNGEAANARTQVVSETGNYSVTSDPERGSEHSIPVQSQVSQETTEGSEVSPQ